MIVHADMDAFYASVEILKRPELAGQAVAVGGPNRQRGVISAANYVARRYGVHSAMPTATAVRLCPQLILLPPRISLYAEYSQQIHQIFNRYTPVIEPLALDEAFLDISHSEKLFGGANNIGKRIKQDIQNELGLVVSIGIAPTKFVAKIASDIEKPNGFVFVSLDQVQAFLDPLPVSRIWGVGKTTEKSLYKLGITRIEHLRQYPIKLLEQQFGKHGLHLWSLANGRDPRRVESEQQIKSVSHETTFWQDIDDPRVVESFLCDLCEQVCARLRQHQLKGRTVTIKIRYADFKTISRSASMDHFSDEYASIWETGKQLWRNNHRTSKQAIRLIGFGVSRLDSSETSNEPRQEDLFTENPLKNRELDLISDQIKKRYGKQALVRGKSLHHKTGKS